jgi:hypothetical protein
MMTDSFSVQMEKARYTKSEAEASLKAAKGELQGLKDTMHVVPPFCPKCAGDMHGPQESGILEAKLRVAREELRVVMAKEDIARLEYLYAREMDKDIFKSAWASQQRASAAFASMVKSIAAAYENALAREHASPGMSMQDTWFFFAEFGQARFRFLQDRHSKLK